MSRTGKDIESRINVAIMDMTFPAQRAAGDVPVPAAARGRDDDHVLGPRHYCVEHLLLWVHNHAFVFLLLLLAFFYLVSGTLMLALTTAYSALTL
jgi:hypothetical protein